MKLLKFLPLLMVLNMDICLCTDLEAYKAFAEDEIDGEIEAAKCYTISRNNKYHLNLSDTTIDEYFEGASKLLHDLVDIIIKPDEKTYYEDIDAKLREIDTYLSTSRIGSKYPETYHIYLAEIYLLDLRERNQYGFKNAKGMPLVDRNHPIIKRHRQIWDEFFEEID